MNGRDILRAATLCFVVGFIGNVISEIHRYMQFKTTVALTRESHERLPMPAVSFCTGFRRDKLEDINWILAPWSGDPSRFVMDMVQNQTILDTFPKSENESLEMWENVTFGLEGLFLDITQYSMTTGPVYVIPHEAVGNETSPVKVRQMGTTSGRCYTVELNEFSVLQGEPVFLRFNASAFEKKRVILYFHHPQARLGLNSNFWPDEVTIVTSEGDSSADLTLNLKTVERHHSKAEGSSLSVETEFYDCINDFTMNQFFANNWMIDNGYLPPGACDNTAPCFHHSLESVLQSRAKELPYCLDFLNYTCSNLRAMDALYKAMMARTSGCSRPRVSTKYMVQTREDHAMVLRDKELALMYLYYETTEIIQETEYILVEFCQAFSSIGGSMGLLLGWSLLDFAKTIAKYQRKREAKKKAKYAERKCNKEDCLNCTSKI